MGFFHLPNQDSLRTYAAYHQIFALQLLWNVGLLGMLIAFLFIISFLLKAYQQKTSSRPSNLIRQSLLSQQSRQQSKRLSQQQTIPMLSQQQQSQQSNQPQTKRFKVCNFMSSLLFYLLWVDIALMYFVFYMFGFMGRGVSHDILTVFLMTLIVLIPTLVWKYTTKFKKLKLIKHQIIFTGLSLLLWIGLTIFMVITLKGACLCYYNDYYGFSVGTDQGPFLSTEWTRSNNIDQICKQNEICNLYATVPERPDSQVFINMHTGTGLQNLTIRLTGPDNKTLQQNITVYTKLLNVQDIGKRYVHTALFTNLSSSTLYRLQILVTPLKEQKYSPALKVTNYKTTPSKETSILKMAIGGDVSMSPQGLTITENLINYDPDVIIIGGDITYDDGMRTCYYSWDNFYAIFDQLNTKLNRLVPLIMSVGNHDVGFDSMATVQLDRESQEIPLFFLYNPQHLSPDNKNNIPDLQDRSTIHWHVIGPTVHLNLDSGYVSEFKSQSIHITTTGQKYSDYYLFANYHNPIYPSCTSPSQTSNDFLAISYAKKYWTPYFDQYNYIAGFQHHTHHKKFTKKIKNGQIDQKGMRFVGDGSWGVVQGSCPQDKYTQQPDKFQFYDLKQPNHIWLVTITNQNKNYAINYTAIDVNGKANYTKVQPLRPLN